MRSFLRYGFTLAAGIAVGMGVVSFNAAWAAEAKAQFFALRVVKLKTDSGAWQYNARTCVKAPGASDETCIDRVMPSAESKCFELYLSCQPK